MKRVLLFLFILIFMLSGCGSATPTPTSSDTAPAPSLTKQIFTGVDFASSPYKHINNGGLTDDSVLPYNIDAISGATMTVEGPAVVTSIPLSIRELENRTEGLVRGTYSDESGMYVYEGLDLWYLLYEMVEGDNGIRLTDTAYRVILKNSNRAEISSFTLREVTAAHEANRPILLAYGMGNGVDSIAPFVFDAKNENEHSLGYVDNLGNDDGCIKLVYDTSEYGQNDYPRFSNVAYVYVCEETEPGFKHTGDKTGAFNTSRYTDYIVTFRGAALGRELNLTTEQLEKLAVYDENGTLIEGGLGYSDWYSLANNAYWYVNEYEGLDLYKLLLYLGMDSAETMGSKAARTTLVSFLASDGATASETFSVDTLSYPDAFGFYNKNASDMNDGSYVSTNADLVKTGYPVLMAYGVNNYPYTINKTDDAYISGLSNSGGPFRIVFGKTQYNHPNGSNQVQFLSEVIVGHDVLYNTHKYTDNDAQNALADDSVKFTVNGTDGATLIEKEFTVGDVEDLIYGPDVTGAQKKAARVKNHYEASRLRGYSGYPQESSIFEGIDLEYLMMNVLGLPGTNGSVTFSNNDDESLTLSLQELFADGYNSTLNRDGLRAVLAFSKNGAPLVVDSNSAGYEDKYAFCTEYSNVYTSTVVDNCGGPLAVLIPSSSQTVCDARSLSNVTSITVDLIPDSYAHISAPYSSLGNSTVKLFGAGLDDEHVYTVSEIESRQTQVKTIDFSFLNKSGKTFEGRYRGLAVYDLFTEIGIKSNAGDVTVYADDGSTIIFSLSQLKKASTNFLAPDKAPVTAMLAYGMGTINGELMDGCPLVPDASTAGYDETLKNDGGPLKLIIPQRNADEVNTSLCIKNVVAIEVSANEVDTWSHSMSDVYEEFLENTFTFTVKNDENEWSRDFTVAELESLKDLIVRAKYTVLDIGECEGLDLWKFIQKFAGNVTGIDNPVSITVYADDGYKNDILSVVYKDGFIKGIETANGERLPVMLCYAINGYPIVDDENHAGYTGLAGNTAGPLRCVVEGTQGASVKYCVKLVVTVAGNDPIDITVDPSVFQGDIK